MPGSKQKYKIIWTGLFWRLALLMVIALLVYIIYFFLVLNKNINKITDNTDLSISQTLSDKQKSKNSLKKMASSFFSKEINLKGSKEKRINILLLGLDGSDRKSGTYLTDTIALISVNPATYQSAILSIPRDLYVSIPKTNYKTKINALYTYGLNNKKYSHQKAISLIKEAVENITGENIPYYIIIDFAGFKKIIETLGGINVEVEQNIVDHRYPGPNYSYETFSIQKGLQHLDGETALKYARVRHVKGGDFGRAHRQQQIMAAAKKKATSLKILSNPQKVLTILNTLGNHLKTNIQPEEIPPMLHLLKNINIHQTNTIVLNAWSKDALLKSTHVLLGGKPAYILIPRAKSYQPIRKLASNIFNINKLKEIKNKITQEQASIQLLTPTYQSYQQSKVILYKWGYTNLNKFNKKMYNKICPIDKDVLISNAIPSKIYTLNDLAGKFDLSVTYKKNKRNSSNKQNITNNSEISKTADIILCLTETSYQYFQEQNQKENQKDVDQSSDFFQITDDHGKVFISK